MDGIFKARAAGIEALQAAIKRCMQPFTMSYCYDTECRLNRPECDLVIYGAFTKALAHAGWVPILGDMPLGRETQSINGLIKCLQSIEFLPYSRHESCLSAFRAKWDEELAAAIKAVPEGYSDVPLAHFGKYYRKAT